MTKQATLGPIDPSLSGPLTPQVPGGPPNQRASVSVEAVQGYLDVAQNELGIKDPASLTQVLAQLADKIHPLVLGQIFRTRAQIREIARKLLIHQKIDEEKRDGIISFLCSESGSHDHTVNRREAKELGLVIEKPSDEFYELLKELYESVTSSLSLRSPFTLDTELAGRDQCNYSVRRALIESISHGSHQFYSEGGVTKLNIPQPGGVPQIGLQDNRNFEGWRKET